LNSDLPTGPILSGATLGVFGGGQLGRMFAMAATQMGYRTMVFAPEADPPAAQVASLHVRADYRNDDAVRHFAAQCDAVTLEFENVPAETLELAARHTLTRPGPKVLAVAQDRLRERAFLDRHDLPCAAHRPAYSAADAVEAVNRLGIPVVLKTARLGYDGRGQRRVDLVEQAGDAWRALGEQPVLCEGWVHYQCELSVLVARSPDGEMQTFGPIRNEHANHILDVSSVPAGVSTPVARHAVELARRVATAIELEGLICVEMFLTEEGNLLINELAPRPHNSGHLTIEACLVSQFEQQVRAVCNLPLGEMTLRGPTAMVNLLGDLWNGGEPDWAAVLGSDDRLRLHLYGKQSARPGRKMGHMTAVATSADKARSAALRARRRLGRQSLAAMADDS